MQKRPLGIVMGVAVLTDDGVKLVETACLTRFSSGDLATLDDFGRAVPVDANAFPSGELERLRKQAEQARALLATPPPVVKK